MGTTKSGWYRTDPTHCRSGKHLIADVGEMADGHCKGCLKEWRNARYERNRESINAARREKYKATYVPAPKAERVQCDKGHTYAVTGRYADGHCSECRRERDRERYTDRKHQVAESSDLQMKRRSYDRDTNHQRRYGLKKGEYAEMLAVQNGVCAICEQPETTVRKGTLMQLAVDHSHTTGERRGLLCNTCNRALGLLKDDAAVIHKFLDYLARFATPI